MWNARLDESQAGIKIAKRNITNLRYADDTTLMAESKAELKSLLRRVKEESKKAVLKLNIHKSKIMASSPNTSQQIEGEKIESLALKNWCSRTMVLEKTLESPVDSKEIKPVTPQENQPWILEGLMLKLKLQYFGHLM